MTTINTSISTPAITFRVMDSGGKQIGTLNQQDWMGFIKTLSTGATLPNIPGSLDDISNGTYFSKVLGTALTSGSIDMSKATGAPSGLGIINHLTSNISDDLGFQYTATYGQVSSLPDTLAGYGITDGQPSLGNATGVQILEQNSGGTPYWANKYGTEIGTGSTDTTSNVTLSGSTGIWSDVSEILSLPATGQPINVKMEFKGYVYLNSITAETEVIGSFLYSTNSGSTWTSVSENAVLISVSGTFIIPYFDSYIVSFGGTTDVQFKYRMQRAVGTSGTASCGLQNLFGTLIPNLPMSVLAGALTASIPSTASGNCSAYYPTTTCTASANVTLATSGGTGGNTFSWTKVSGTGTLTNTTSQTVTVSDTETTSDAGATYTTVFNGTVTDSASSTATSSNCTFTGTFNRLYNPVVVSVPSTANGSCSTGTTCGSNCTASASVTGTPSGGDGSYSHSWTRVSGSTFVLTNTTSATVTASYLAATSSPFTSYSEVIRDTVTDGHSNSGYANCTVTLTFRCFT
jgi:hypothetical protein